MSFHILIFYGALHATMVELSNFNRDWSAKPKKFTIWTFLHRKKS